MNVPDVSKKGGRVWNAVMVTLGVIDDLRRKGQIVPGPELTATGRAEYEKLLASGYEPTEADLIDAAAYIRRRYSRPPDLKHPGVN